MTKRFVGNITVTGTDTIKVEMPSCTDIPAKTEWHSAAIWQFNGKRYTPLTQKAEDNLVQVVKDIEALGKTKATKDGKLKPTSIRYGILTTGVEPFYYI